MRAVRRFCQLSKTKVEYNAVHHSLVSEHDLILTPDEVVEQPFRHLYEDVPFNKE
jgi:hypothetical protein